MSGYSERATCPRCLHESLERSIDRDDVTGVCIDCGYEYHTESSILTLEKLNEGRKAYGLEPLETLALPRFTDAGATLKVKVMTTLGDFSPEESKELLESIFAKAAKDDKSVETCFGFEVDYLEH